LSLNSSSGPTLPPYRVLDLTEGGCMIGGRLLADLGAEVIKIEPPGGSLSRIGPYYRDEVDPQKSLFWFTFNFNKRGITLDILKPAGQLLFKQLVQKADIVLESFEPGYMDRLGIGYDDLRTIKPDIVFTAITPFGQSGPKAHYKASDLTIWASGAYLYACGNPDRAPVCIGFPQASLFGGTEGATGSLTAIWQRGKTGRGQFVDVSMQECAISPNMNVMQMWGANKVIFRRTGGAAYVPSTGVRQPIYYQCKDGFAMILLQGGVEPFVSSSRRLVKWMTEEGLAPDWLQKLNWVIDYNASTMDQEMADKTGAAVEKFTLIRTKSELYEEGAMRRQIMIAPVNTAQDISEDLQLKARGYWQKLDHPELQEGLVYCGPFVKMSETPITYKQRAPLIGEHNWEIYVDEMGIQKDDLARLRGNRVI
jgi:crotonobetainyl-CoA:carnitine CoA-transferase CaiB-like acyl-CoA transferase